MSQLEFLRDVAHVGKANGVEPDGNLLKDVGIKEGNQRSNCLDVVGELSKEQQPTFFIGREMTPRREKGLNDLLDFGWRNISEWNKMNCHA